MAQHQDHHEVDAHTGVSTTGHEWDGIRELNTPLPRWWLGIFYATIVWSVGYWVVYPAWPLITGATQGVIGYASRIEIAKDLALLQQHRASQSSGLAEASLEQIKADPSLFRIAMAQGKASFDAKAAAESAEVLAVVSKLPFTAFVEGSDKGETRAKPEIWKESAKFKEAADKNMVEMAKLVAAAKAQ